MHVIFYFKLNIIYKQLEQFKTKFVHILINQKVKLHVHAFTQVSFEMIVKLKALTYRYVIHVHVGPWSDSTFGKKSFHTMSRKLIILDKIYINA